MSNETFEDYCRDNFSSDYFEDDTLTRHLLQDLWEYLKPKLDLEIQANTKMKEEYRQLKELSDYREDLCKSEANAYHRAVARELTLTAQLELLTRCGDIEDCNEFLDKRDKCQGCKNAALIKGKG